MSKYWENAKKFQKQILKYLKIIASLYKNELDLKIEEVNLLEDESSIIKSSTAIGFCLEEFFSVKLKLLSESGSSSLKIERSSDSTNNLSYDSFSYFNGDKFLINFKADKKNNNAISAINKLYKDYVENNNEQIDYHFLILKVKYEISKNKKIKILDFDSFYLEEIDFKLGYKQDNRNWSTNFNKNSGRLIIDNRIRNGQRVNVNNISYNNTKNQISSIYIQNLSYDLGNKLSNKKDKTF